MPKDNGITNPISFLASPDGVRQLESNVANLLVDADEAKAANKALLEEERRVSEDNLRLLHEQSQSDAALAATEAGLLQDARQKMARMNEIDDSFLLRLAEPIAGIFNPDFSRERLAADIARTDANLTLLDRERRITSDSTSVKLKQNAEKLTGAAATAAVQANDVQAGAEALRITQQARDMVLDLRSELLLNASDEDIASGKLVKEGLISEQQNKRTQELRQSEVWQRQRERATTIMTQYQLEEAELERLSIEELLSEDAANRFSPGIRAEVVRRKQSAQVVLNAQILSLEAAKRAERADTMTPAQLKKLREENPSAVSEQEYLDSLSRDKDRKSRDATAEATRKKQERDNAIVYLNNATNEELARLQKEAAESGGTVKSGPWQGVISETDVANAIIARRDVTARLTVGALGITDFRHEVAGAVSEYARVAGLPDMPDGTPTEVQLDTLINDTKVPEHIKGRLSEMRNSISNLEKLHGTGSSLVIEQRAQLSAQVAEFRKEQAEAHEARIPASQRGAMGEWRTTGSISTNDNAINIAVPAAVTREQPRYREYANAYERFRTLGSSYGLDKSKTAIGITADQTIDALSAAAVDKNVLDEVGKPVVGSMMENAYALAFEAVGDKGAAQLLRAGHAQFAADDKGTFDSKLTTRKILDYIASGDRKYGIPEFQQALQQTIAQVAQAERKKGSSDAVTAAMQRLLFAGDERGTLADHVYGAWHDGIRGMKQTAINQRDALPVFGGFRPLVDKPQ